MNGSGERLQRLGISLTVATVAWGALAFGAVYPWAYSTLAALALAAAAAGWRAGRASPRRSISPAFLAALASIGVVAAVQLVPVPLGALTRLDPGGVSLVRQFDPQFAIHPGPHAISVWPAGTMLALALFCVFAILLAGTTMLLSLGHARRFIERLIIVGVLLALIGIVQKPLYAGRIYGFWEPIEGGNPFGPFVNRNHFAGWMLMALPVALGYLCAGIDRAMRGVRPDWPSRLRWLSSPDANKLIMVAMAVAMMGLSIGVSLSRSGILFLGLALAVMTWLALRRLQGRSSKALAAVYLVLLAVLLLTWTGVDTVANRFSDAHWAGFDGRGGAAIDAAATFRRHWLTGTGLNTYQVANLFYQQHDLEAIFSSAHNDYLQLAAEGGIFLAGAVIACIVLFVRDVRRRFAEDAGTSAYWLRAGAVTALLAIACQETVEFSLQMPGNAALFAVVCALALHKSPRGHVVPSAAPAINATSGVAGRGDPLARRTRGV